MRREGEEHVTLLKRSRDKQYANEMLPAVWSTR